MRHASQGNGRSVRPRTLLPEFTLERTNSFFWKGKDDLKWRNSETLQSHIISLCSYVGHAFHVSMYIHRMFSLLRTFFTIFPPYLIKVFTELHPCFCPRQIVFTISVFSHTFHMGKLQPSFVHSIIQKYFLNVYCIIGTVLVCGFKGHT